MLAGVAAAAVVICEQRVLAALDATPDPDTDNGFRFPSERTHAILASDGARLHVEEGGTGRPIVMLHGHGANLGIFAPLAARLVAGGQRVVAVDHRGFGRSAEVPDAFDFHGLVDDLVTVLTALDLRDAIVVGHSMGGAVALGLAVERPDIIAERVAGLVVVNGSARGPADRPIARAKAAALDWGLTEHLGRHPRHGIALARANFGVDPRRSHVVAVRALGFDSPAARRAGLTRRLLGIDFTGRLGDVDVPVLVLAGDADRVLPPHESQRIADSILGARLEVFPGAGHLLPVERSAQVAERILAFADQVDGGGGIPAKLAAS